MLESALLSSSSFPSTLSSQEEAEPPPPPPPPSASPSAGSLAGKYVLEMKMRSFRFCFRGRFSASCEGKTKVNLLAVFAMPTFAQAS